ncbi:MAG: hypothetical protein HUK18_06965, partial [Bacteroidales bacterium]|nr:hypothetical protein [Bacteroidales bacterium]MCF0211029.1 hypothetical protein [Bacteroidales bacterium]
EQDKQGNPIDANGNLVLEDANVSSGKSQTTDTGEFSTEDDIEFSIDKDELYNNVPYDMPIEFVKEIKSWDIINRSPYSFSFYNANGISWEGKPDKSLRIADHWNFYSKGSTHCVTDTEPEPNSWTLAKYHDKTKTYEILKSIPKADLAHSIINAFYYNNIQEDPVDIINKIYNVVLELDKLGTLSDVINREIKINTNAIEDALLRRDNGKNISNKIDISQYNSYLDYIKTLDDKRAKTITLLFENNFDFNKEYTYKLPIKKLPPVDNYFRSKYLDKDDNEVIKNFLTINNSNYTFIDNYRPVSREKIDSFIKDINDAKKDIPELQKIGNEKSSEKAPQDLTTSIVALSSKDFAKLQ